MARVTLFDLVKTGNAYRHLDTGDQLEGRAFRKLVGVPEGQRPTDAQFVQLLMLSLLGMACFNSERMLEWAAEAFDWFGAALMPNPVRDCCLIRTNIVCIRVGPYCISICTRHVNALYFI